MWAPAWRCSRAKGSASAPPPTSIARKRRGRRSASSSRASIVGTTEVNTARPGSRSPPGRTGAAPRRASPARSRGSTTSSPPMCDERQRAHPRVARPAPERRGPSARTAASTAARASSTSRASGPCPRSRSATASTSGSPVGPAARSARPARAPCRRLEAAAAAGRSARRLGPREQHLGLRSGASGGRRGRRRRRPPRPPRTTSSQPDRARADGDEVAARAGLGGLELTCDRLPRPFECAL